MKEVWFQQKSWQLDFSFQTFWPLKAICKTFLILRRCFRQMPSVFVRNFCIVPPDSFFLLWFLPFLPHRVEVYDKILSFANRVGLTVTLYPWIFNDNLIEFYGVFAVWSSKTLYPTITKNTFFYPILLPNCGSREIFLINFKPIEEFNLFQKLY